MVFLFYFNTLRINEKIIENTEILNFEAKLMIVGIIGDTIDVVGGTIDNVRCVDKVFCCIVYEFFFFCLFCKIKTTNKYILLSK